jgi:transposase InsO family protein
MKQIANTFSKYVYNLHGFPKVIVSDRYAKFKSKFWKKFCKHRVITLNMSLTYHPQIEGQVEIVNKCVEAYLHCFTIDKQNK